MSKNYGGFIFFIIIVITFSIIGGKMEQNAYDEGYSDAKEEYSNYDHHESACDGRCEHVESSIENRIYDGELIRRDDALSDDDMEESYWEGAYDGYIQGYGDRYYGNERELDISEYKDEDMF